MKKLNEFKEEVISKIKEILKNENYEIKTSTNNKKEMVVSYKHMNSEKYSIIVIDDEMLVVEINDLINPTIDIFEKSIKSIAIEFEKYYSAKVNEYQELKHNFKANNNFKTVEGVDKYYGITIVNLEYKKTISPKTFENVLIEKSLESAIASVQDTKSKIEKKLNGTISKIENATIGLNGNLNGNFYNENDEGLYFYTIKAEGDIQKPHYRLLNSKLS